MRRLGVAGAVAAALALPLLLRDEYVVHLLVMSGMYYLLAGGLNLLMSTGQLSLGHTAFFGIGAYTSGLLNVRYGMPFWIGLPGAALVTGIVGYAIGRITLNLRGAYFVLVTIGFSEVMRLVATNWIDLTNGPLGLTGVERPYLAVPGLLTMDFRDNRESLFLILLLVLPTFALCSRIHHSKIGRAIRAIRQNESLAASTGVSAFHTAMLTLVLGTALAGVAGSFYAHYVNFLSPELFGFFYTVTMVVMVVAGGEGTVWGPLVGAVVFTVLPELLRAATFYRMLLYGAILILVVVFMPKGIVVYARRALARLAWVGRLVRPQLASPAVTGGSEAKWALAADPAAADGDGPGPALVVEGLTVRFDGLVALQELGLELRRQEILGLIGPNGAGKTTAFNAITGFCPPTRGEVQHRGLSLLGHPPHHVARQGVIRTFQKTSVFPEATVLENIRMACYRRTPTPLWATLFRTRRVQAQEREILGQAERILAFTGLQGRREDLARNLPFGEQRLLGVAIALGAAPAVLLMDEPAAGLNASESRQMMALIREIRDRGISVLLVEHDMKLVMGICDRIVVLDYGKKVAEGTPREIQANPEVVRAYLGTAEIYAGA